MLSSKQEKILYEDIQKKLFYLIPEKWESIFLYASIIDVPFKRPVGEMYFYYFPKGIIKKKPINAYEIPTIFNIDEDKYSELINSLYNTIKKLREIAIKKERKVWSNITISIEKFHFKVEYDYENLNKSKYTPYERHVIWRYNYLHLEMDLYSKNERNIIDRYLYDISMEKPLKKDIYLEGIYEEPVHNIIEYEKTLSVDEAIARTQKEEKIKRPRQKILKSKKQQEVEEEEDFSNNQILFGGRKKD